MTDRLGNNAAAAHLGIKPSTWRDYVADKRAPAPDGIDEGFGKPYWLKSTLDRWNDSRPGHGGRPRKHQEDLDANAQLVERMERTASDPDSRIRRGRPRRSTE